MTIWKPLTHPVNHLRSDEESKLQVIPSYSSGFVSSALEDNFVNLLPKDERIERVFWAFENEVLRIWTVIDTPDFEFETKIYDAQLGFMDLIPELGCDFSVIYRFGKPLNSLKPTTAVQAYPR
jgi:hypothetical protein